MGREREICPLIVWVYVCIKADVAVAVDANVADSVLWSTRSLPLSGTPVPVAELLSAELLLLLLLTPLLVLVLVVLWCGQVALWLLSCLLYAVYLVSSVCFPCVLLFPFAEGGYSNVGLRQSYRAEGGAGYNSIQRVRKVAKAACLR